MGQEYPPEKDTKHSAPAPLRRRLHEFYFGGSLFVVLRAANRTAPDLSFRAHPRGATACRENVFLLLANTLAPLSQLCRTRIIEGGKIIPRKFLRPNNWQKEIPHRVPGNAIMMFLYKKDHLPGEKSPAGGPGNKVRYRWTGR